MLTANRFQKFIREVLVLSKLNHPNIVQFVGYFLNVQKLTAWIISHWASHGDVGRYLRTSTQDFTSKLRLVGDFLQLPYPS